jgi:glyoxylase-like metal-dependent hydrolase (beta-lactamase superfamily II)
VPVYVGSGETHAKAAVHMFTRGTVDNMVGHEREIYEWPFEKDQSGRFQGMLDVFGDGMLYALHLPGHTPGTTAFLARTTDGPVLLTGDVSHTDWGWRHCVEPGSYNLDGDGAAESLKVLRALQAELPSLEVHLGHQPHKANEEHMSCAR